MGATKMSKEEREEVDRAVNEQIAESHESVQIMEREIAQLEEGASSEEKDKTKERIVELKERVHVMRTEIGKTAVLHALEHGFKGMPADKRTSSGE